MPGFCGCENGHNAPIARFQTYRFGFFVNRVNRELLNSRNSTNAQTAEDAHRGLVGPQGALRGRHERRGAGRRAREALAQARVGERRGGDAAGGQDRAQRPRDGRAVDDRPAVMR